jgi:Cd2+/Zn2+-exporting ATPase
MENVVFALGAKGIFIVLAGLGMANMWIALIADVGVALLAVMNSVRALRQNDKN